LNILFFRRSYNLFARQRLRDQAQFSIWFLQDGWISGEYGLTTGFVSRNDATTQRKKYALRRRGVA